MRKLTIVLFALMALAAACSKSSTPAADSSPAGGGPGGGGQGGEPATKDCPDLSADNPFTIKTVGNSFVPSCLTASSAASLTLVNEDAVDHNLTIDGTPIDVPLPANATQNFESAGLEPGVYQFHCSLHPSMTGTMTVT